MNKEEIIKLIEEDIKIQKNFLTGNFNNDRPTEWRIVGMRKLLKDIK